MRRPTETLDPSVIPPRLGQDRHLHPQAVLQGSPQQQAIWAALASEDVHVLVEALAGTGKTTTIVEGLKRLQPGQTSGFVAFNKSIARELQARVPPGVRACTLHSLGFGVLRQEFGNVAVNDDKTYELVPDHPRRSKSSNRWLRNTVSKLVSLCKGRLLDGADISVLLDLAAEYDIDLGSDYDQDLILEEVPRALEASRDVKTSGVDFDDMIWLPVVLGLRPRPFDTLMVDESQDLNPAQQAMVLAWARRLVVVGDKHQAIYGFRGADVQAMANLQAQLGASERGLRVFPLTITRRCPVLVTHEAQLIVPAFECEPDTRDGTVCFGPTGDQALTEAPERGDMVLCRTNAPIIQLAYELIRADVPVKIQGRDIGGGLSSLIRRLVPDGGSTLELLRKLDEHRTRETAKIDLLPPSQAEARLQALGDKLDCIYALCEGLDDVGQVLRRVEQLFADVSQGETGRFVLLSSIHRAKGLEADVVRVIHPELLPHPMAKTDWARAQELNLKYVAFTRARETLHVH